MPPAIRPLRVLHVVNRLGERGDGISNVCVDLACQQADEGDVVAIATAEGGFTDLVREHGVQILPVNFQVRSPVKLARAVSALSRAVQQFRPDVIHSHTLVATIVARIAGKRHGVPIIATVHNEYQRGVVLMGLADVVVGVSKAVSQAMATRRISASKIRTVLNGTVGSPRMQTSQTNAPDLPARSVVVVGAVSKRKGADLVVDVAEAMSAKEPAHFYFVGNVDWQELRERVERSSAADYVHFVGFDPDPKRFMAAAGAYLLASRRDPAPLVLAEALDAGARIVATAVDGVPELLGDPPAGVLVESEDVDGLVSGVERVLDDPEFAAALSLRSRARAEYLSVSRVCAEYRGVYESLLRPRVEI